MAAWAKVVTHHTKTGGRFPPPRGRRRHLRSVDLLYVYSQARQKRGRSRCWAEAHNAPGGDTRCPISGQRPVQRATSPVHRRRIRFGMNAVEQAAASRPVVASAVDHIDNLRGGRGRPGACKVSAFVDGSRIDGRQGGDRVRTRSRWTPDRTHER
jgi:hypothetical protein